MSQIRIVNWLITRRCNINCDYCSIVKNYPDMPSEYPKMDYYIKNEMTSEVIIKALGNFKKHNPEAFHIWYGGEPTLRKDLVDIINYCNNNDIYYTIISNNTDEIQPLIKRLFEKTDYIEGFTSSVDPHGVIEGYIDDKTWKSIQGLKRLKEIQLSGKVKDVVAEITVMYDNQHLLYDMVKHLSSEGIYSDITFVDIKKSPYYDFSNVEDHSQLVKPTWELASTLMYMYNDKSLLIHMKNMLLPAMFDTLPSNMDCGLEKGIHNITVDAEGSIRLCLRIRGTETSKLYNIENMFDENSKDYISSGLQNSISDDKQKYCKLCNHSCLMMSKHIDKHGDKEGELVHKDKRED